MCHGVGYAADVSAHDNIAIGILILYFALRFTSIGRGLPIPISRALHIGVELIETLIVAIIDRRTIVSQQFSAMEQLHLF